MLNKKKVTRKVISKLSVKEVGAQTQAQDSDESVKKFTKSKKVCLFCQNKSAPIYTDSATLSRLLTDRVKIVPKIRSGLCSKHQRSATKQIKYARHLALLPFTPKV